MTVERIFTKAPGEVRQQSHLRVTVVAGAGIEGDRYFAAEDEPGQNLTLIEAEEIEAFLTAHGRPHDLSISSRNIVTRGVRLNPLVGQEFTLGNVRLRGVELCEPCLGLGQSLADEALTPAAVVKALVHRAGLRCDVLDSGTIACGDKLA